MSDSLLAIFQAYLLLIGSHWHSSKKLPMHHTSSLDCSEWDCSMVCVCTAGCLLWTPRVYELSKCWSEVCVCVCISQRQWVSTVCLCVRVCLQDFSLLHLTCFVKCELRRWDQFRVRCWCEETSTHFFKVITDLIPVNSWRGKGSLQLSGPFRISLDLVACKEGDFVISSFLSTACTLSPLTATSVCSVLKDPNYLQQFV